MVRRVGRALERGKRVGRWVGVRGVEEVEEMGGARAKGYLDRYVSDSCSRRPMIPLLLAEDGFGGGFGGRLTSRRRVLLEIQGR